MPDEKLQGALTEFAGEPITPESLKNLVDALEAGLADSSTISKSPIAVEDLSNLAEKYLTRSAKYDLQNKSCYLVRKEDDGTFYRCIYFAVQVREDNVEGGIQMIAPAINKLSEDGLIHSTLAGVSSVKLAKMPLKDLAIAVFCYVLVPDSKYDEIKQKYKDICVEEGGVPSEGESFEPKLETGEFLAQIRLSAVFCQEYSSTSERLDKEIQNYLKVLPEGTIVRNVTECAITDLSIPFEVKFYNPLMSEFKRVELTYIRTCARIGEHIETFNLLLGIGYQRLNGEWVKLDWK